MRKAGILMPVASLPDRHGCGSFGKEAYHFIDLAEKAGFSIWQILPLNPLGYGNSPYQPYSSFAMDDIYISLDLLYEQGLIEDPYLYRALPTAVSDRVSVVQTLSKEDVAAIWAVNPDELSPKALRDYAMVCIGLTMGFRASDIVSIRFSDIDWKQKSICVIQQKTGKALVLPMPVKTGNILFRYLRDGRPKSDEPYVFIRHEAPYDRIQRGVCRSALKRFLGIQKHSGCNFHAVRKTFATKLLEGGTNVELISDALGHSNDSTVHKYLSLDEKRMRMCTLSMAETGIFFKGGAFHA